MSGITMELLFMIFVAGFLAPYQTGVSRWRSRSAPTGVAAVSPEQNSLKVFPNPAFQSIMISYSVPGNEKAIFTIASMTGTVLRNFTADNSDSQEQGKQETKVDVSFFAPGTYLLRMQSSTVSATTKFTVLP